MLAPTCVWRFLRWRALPPTCRFTNREDIDFSNATDLTPVQVGPLDWECQGSAQASSLSLVVYVALQRQHIKIACVETLLVSAAAELCAYLFLCAGVGTSGEQKWRAGISDKVGFCSRHQLSEICHCMTLQNLERLFAINVQASWRALW